MLFFRRLLDPVVAAVLTSITLGSAVRPALAQATEPLSLAVIGDSDSQGFQGLVDPGVIPVPRGGTYHATSLQWTEVLARLRPAEIDLGSHAVHGMSGRLARGIEFLRLDAAVESLGFEVRAPRKLDHRYNFAFSGDGCAELFGGWSRQTPRLVRLIQSDPVRWRSGVVVIKIGGNDFANDVPNLDSMARDPKDPRVTAKMDFCLAEIRKSVQLIQRAQPRIRIVLGGVFDNAHWAKYHAHWQSAAALQNIGRGLDHFDHALQSMADADERLAFFSDRVWFDGLWGGRSGDGRPDYRVLSLGPGVEVSNTIGDAPSNSTLADGHAGLVWNAKWAQALVALLNRRFGLKVRTLTDDELYRFVIGTGAFQPSK